jgi:hypothetical protein
MPTSDESIDNPDSGAGLGDRYQGKEPQDLLSDRQ